jgi:hypothetical protein
MADDDSAAEVARLEAIEHDASADFWAAAPEAPRRAFGIAHRRLGDGVLLTAPGLDGGLMFNRLAGYGVSGAASGDELDEAISGFEASGVKTWTVQVAPTATGLAGLAAARGLTPHPRPWVKFLRGPEPAAPGGLPVRPAEPRDATAFGEVLCASFGMPDGVAPWAGALVGRPRWRCFLAFDGAEPVGVGALFLGDGLGWLGFGGTLPSHRGRGGQTAMFAARIAAGLAAGCRGFVTETGAPLPGEAAPSFRNIGRAGFREIYRRPNLRRPPALSV